MAMKDVGETSKRIRAKQRRAFGPGNPSFILIHSRQMSENQGDLEGDNIGALFSQALHGRCNASGLLN